jgi:NAD(P)-dependent dehydrogenase (short-subunit alcohol dehydrogenase family)
MAKVALVTGGTRGIGAAITRALARQSYHVVVTFRENRKAAEEFQREFADQNALDVVQSDVCNDTANADLISFMQSHFGRLDVLVNNAGRVIVPPDWSSLTREAFIETLNTNLVGPTLLAREALPLLKAAGPSSILNIGSVYGIIADANVIAYSCSKAGLVLATAALAKELAPLIRVNAILPGHIDTDMTRGAGSEFISMVVGKTPVKRLGSPEEIASLAVYLSSPESHFITGQSFTADGGYMLR